MDNSFHSRISNTLSLLQSESILSTSDYPLSISTHDQNVFTKHVASKKKLNLAIGLNNENCVIECESDSYGYQLSDYTESHIKHANRENLVSIIKGKKEEQSMELTDLGESSILKFLNQLYINDNINKSKSFNKQSFLDSFAEDYEAEKTELLVLNSNKKNNYKSTQKILVLKNKIMPQDQHIDKELKSYSLDDVELINTLRELCKISKNKRSSQVLNNNNMFTSLEDEINYLKEIFNKLDSIELILGKLYCEKLSKNSKTELLSVCEQFLQNVCITLLSKNSSSGLATLELYNERAKQIAFINKSINLQNGSNNSTISHQDRITSKNSVLLKELETHDSLIVYDFSNTSKKAFVRKTIKKKEESLILLNKLLFKLLRMFTLIILIFKANSNYNDVLYIDMNLKTFDKILFQMLSVSEILKSSEFLIRLQVAFDHIQQYSLKANRLFFYSQLTKKNVVEYHQKINNIPLSCRSISKLDKIDNNEWGKYLLLKRCVNEFDKKCNNALNIVDLNFFENHSSSQRLDYDKELTLDSSNFQIDGNNATEYLAINLTSIIVGAINTNDCLKSTKHKKSTKTAHVLQFIKKHWKPTNLQSAKGNNTSSKILMEIDENTLNLKTNKPSKNQLHQKFKKRSFFNILNILQSKKKNNLALNNQYLRLPTYKSLIVMTKHYNK
ncbi:hypothetical protein QEN19_003740 [Hanseniaspora menglaensis]